MQNAKSILISKTTLTIFTIFFIISSLPIFFFEKEQIVISINRIHNPTLDNFAHFLTFIGGLWFYIFFLAVLFFSKLCFKKLFFAGFSFFNASIIVQILKNFFFTTHTRPIVSLSLQKIYIANDSFLTETTNSFPSGHSSTAFVLSSIVFFFFFIKNEKFYIYQIALLMAASFIALSRVYFCMHFYHDVYVGAFIGIFITLLTRFLLERINWPKWTRENGFIEIIKTKLLTK